MTATNKAVRALLRMADAVAWQHTRLQNCMAVHNAECLAVRPLWRSACWNPVTYTEWSCCLYTAIVWSPRLWRFGSL